MELAPLGGTRRVGGLLGVAGRLSGTVSPFRAEQGTSLETPWRARCGVGEAQGSSRSRRYSFRPCQGAPIEKDNMLGHKSGCSFTFSPQIPNKNVSYGPPIPET